MMAGHLEQARAVPRASPAWNGYKLNPTTAAAAAVHVPPPEEEVPKAVQRDAAGLRRGAMSLFAEAATVQAQPWFAVQVGN